MERNPLSVISSMKDLVSDLNLALDNGFEFPKLESLSEYKSELEIINKANKKLTPISKAALLWKIKTLKGRELENSKIINYDDLVKEPKKVLSETLDFLGFKWDESGYTS